ncbi:hypothetical protein LCGC14_2075790, partial [marine sediment metagenome]
MEDVTVRVSIEFIERLILVLRDVGERLSDERLSSAGTREII